MSAATSGACTRPPSLTEQRRPRRRKPRLKLGTWKDVPEYQQRPFILTGYRLQCTGCAQCVLSVVALHNETANIWTHLLGLFYVAYRGVCVFLDPEAYVGDPLFWHGVSMQNALVVVMHVVTCFCLGASAFYHTRHCDVERACYACFYVDLFGIVLQVVATLAMGIAIGFRCFPVTMQFYHTCVVLEGITMTCSIMLDCLSEKTRAIILSVCGLLGLAPAFHFFIVADAVEVAHLWPTIAGITMCFLIGVFFFVNRYPESLWPGAFDYAGQSHNIWHVWVFFGMLVWLRGIEGLIALHKLSSC